MIMNTPQIQDFAGKRIHMIGIGGSSMSGLAQMLQHLGYQVTGSDQNDGYLMNDVRQAGAKVTIGHRAENVHGADLVVYTAAIPLTNPERAEAERLHIPSMERAELLGQLMRHCRESRFIPPRLPSDSPRRCGCGWGHSPVRREASCAGRRYGRGWSC